MGTKLLVRLNEHLLGQKYFANISVFGSSGFYSLKIVYGCHQFSRIWSTVQFYKFSCKWPAFLWYFTIIFIKVQWVVTRVCFWSKQTCTHTNTKAQSTRIRYDTKWWWYKMIRYENKTIFSIFKKKTASTKRFRIVFRLPSTRKR